MELFNTLLIALPVVGGLVFYFICLETKLAQIKTDLTWIKKVLDSRRTPRKEEA